jgi:phospholipase D1/2
VTSQSPLDPGRSLLLEEGRNCWKVKRANRAAFIVDAADYYRLALQAMLKAEKRIILIGWDVDTRVALADEPPEPGVPVELGPLFTWLSRHRSDLRIYILAWDEGLISVPGRGTTPFRMLRWALDPQVAIKWDSTHPVDASHHQKLLVIDDRLAFCGGIDITGSRWDTRRHKDEEPGRRRPFTRRAYEPWHDAIMAVDGDAAAALGELARIRWDIATGECLEPPGAGEGDIWPEGLEPGFRDVDVAIARTRGKDGEISEVREIEALFLDLIHCAQRLVYVETQYFASRAIAEAIGKRLGDRHGPEFVIVNPRTAEGWLDEAVMGPARALLYRSLKAQDRFGKLRIYTPVTEGGLDIYVHAKVMIVDDRMLRVGSANMNNRSMGLDSESDLLIDGTSRADVRATIAAIRADLVAEHLGVPSKAVTDCLRRTGSLIETIEALRGHGRTLKPFEPPEINALEAELADKETLDPEGSRESFEPRRPRLLSRLRGAGRGRAPAAPHG